MAFDPNGKRFTMASVKVCDRCDDMGYVIGEKRNLQNPLYTEKWKEVCPYCMPTTKYGNLRTLLKRAPSLLEDKSQKDNNDEGTNPDGKDS